MKLRGRAYPLLVLAAAILVSCLFLGMYLFYSQGNASDDQVNIAPPLDDTYIHLQYGRQIGEGEWFRYNDGDPITTGASSFLYVLVLGAVHFLGLGGDYLLGFAMGLGALLLAVAALLGYKLGRRLAGERAGLWSGLLIAGNGAFAWGATSGMEVGLLSVLMLGTLLAFVRELSSGRFLLTPVVAALAALTRPEGLFFAVVITGAVLFALLKGFGKGRPSARPVRFAVALLYALLPIAAGAAQHFYYRTVTGSGVQNGVLAKSLLYEPVFYPTEFVDQVFQNFAAVTFTVLMGLDPDLYLFPGAILFCFLGVLHLAFGDARYRVFAVASGVALVLAMLSIATLRFPETHHYRYFLPFFPLVLVFAVVGFYSLTTLKRETWLPEALGGFAVLFCLLGLPMWATTAGADALQIEEQQVTVGYWIRENLPPGARVGINDAGATRYYGEHPTVDLVGLTTNGVAVPYRNGAGSLYEALENMPEEERPDYFVIYPDWTPGSLDVSGVLGEAIATFPLSNRPSAPGLVGGSEVLASRADWELAGSGERFVGDGVVKDTIDVAEIESETEHDYELGLPLIGLEPENVLVQESYPDGRVVVDAGRAVPGSEAFTVEGLTAGRPLEVRMRTTGSPFSLRARVDGQDVGEWSFETSGTGWEEVSFTLPAEVVRSETLRLELSPPEDAPLETHTAYHYWFVQEE